MYIKYIIPVNGVVHYYDGMNNPNPGDIMLCGVKAEDLEIKSIRTKRPLQIDVCPECLELFKQSDHPDAPTVVTSSGSPHSHPCPRRETACQYCPSVPLPPREHLLRPA